MDPIKELAPSVQLHYSTSSLIGIAIRRMEPTDAEEVARLFAKVLLALPYYNEVAKESELAQYTPERLRSAIAADPDAVLIAQTESEVVGFCISRNDDGLIWLSWFGVAHGSRRQGVGSALLDRLEATVRAGRSHKIWCDCRTENVTSARVLRRHNFAEICTVRMHWYRQDFILWEKLVG